MNRLFKAQSYFVYVSLILALLLGSCAGPGAVVPTPTPIPPPAPGSQALLGDFGDAPDGDHNMDTGYYAPTGGPWVFTYSSAGVAADFPTMGRDQVPGPYMLDVDEFWIGPLFGISDPMHIPSIEDDADDLKDPDGVANLLVNGSNADCDQENGAHNPAGSGCAPMAAYSMPMNARLLIFFGYPPLGIWITTVHASETMSYSGPVYWNLLYDLDQDGSWENSTEWIARDMRIDLEPGESKTLISPPFRFPTSGTPWGRLKFPNWVRSMVSSENMGETFNGQDWDGRGIEGGFEVGEVEDYFVEWFPLGQRFPNQNAGGGDPPPPLLNADEMLIKIPTTRGMDDILRLLPGDQVDEIEIINYANMETGGVSSFSVVMDMYEEATEATLEEEGLFFGETLDFSSWDLGVTALQGTPGLAGIVSVPDLFETGPVEVRPGIFHQFQPETGNTIIFEGGFFGVTLIVILDDAGHVIFIGMPEQLMIEVLLGNITITGPLPWVEVSGEYDEATGEFSAEGTGTVAGFPNIKVTFNGTVNAETIFGEYTMGAEGGLPQNEPIVYRVEGDRVEESSEQVTIEPGPVPLDSGIEDAIQSFIKVFNEAFAAKNPDPLYQLLHPAVGEIYGEEACLEYITGIVETPTMLEYLDAAFVGKWDFERDDVVVPVDFAYSVQANFTADDQTSPLELHLYLPGDDSVRWFTDCGEPLAGE